MTDNMKPMTLETQEAGTGKWFPIVQYSPGDDTQSKRAREAAEVLRTLGLYARVTSTEGSQS